MPRLPRLIASSVIRGAQFGESHGGLYLVDLEQGGVELKLDWNRTDIDISGRGGDRGLRGVAVHGEHLLVAANSELLLLDQSFSVVDSFSNPYLLHCHEISVANGQVFLASTGFDSVLVFDLTTRRFVQGFYLTVEGEGIKLKRYDPMAAGPGPGRRFHLNSVKATAAGIWFSGLHTPGLLFTNGRNISLAAPLPRGTHNAQPYVQGVIYNDTASDRICYRNGAVVMEIAVPRFEREQILNMDRFESTVARPGFARGLCILGDGLVAGGSAPSTIAVYDLQRGECVLQRNISMDVRNAIHGMAIWPY